LLDCAGGSADKQACIDGWLKDAGPLIKTARERQQSQEYLDYYIQRILRDHAKQAEYCAAPAKAG